MTSMRQNGSPFEKSKLELLAAAEPGDAVELWMENACIVQCVYRCREEFDGQVTEWRWMFLDDGSLIETSPDGSYRYGEHLIVKQGTPLYEELVAQDGALVRFEERVRAGLAGRRPVHVTINGVEYRIASTGTARIERVGEPPDLVPWRSTSSDPRHNIYFGLVSTADEERAGIGLWTAHVCLSFGRPLEEAQIANVYHRERR